MPIQRRAYSSPGFSEDSLWADLILQLDLKTVGKIQKLLQGIVSKGVAWYLFDYFAPMYLRHSLLVPCGFAVLEI